jgi:hypothetical protein
MFLVAHRQARSFESGGCGTSQDAKRFFEQQLACWSSYAHAVEQIHLKLLLEPRWRGSQLTGSG